MATTKKTAIKKTTATKLPKKLTPKEILAMLKTKYDEVFDDEGVYTIKGNGKWGFADTNGDVKIKPCFARVGEEWCVKKKLETQLLSKLSNQFLNQLA